MKPFYQTRLGSAYLGDATETLENLPRGSVNLIVTSPPFPLTFQKKKPYGSIRIEEYIAWLLPIADQCKRLLTEDGSLVIDIGGVWNRGAPTRSLYQYHLLLALSARKWVSILRRIFTGTIPGRFQLPPSG